MARCLIPLAALALSAFGSPALAQGAQPGWIGISFEVNAVDGVDEAVNAPGLVITDVRRASPADAAGIRVGDRLLAIDDLRGADDLRNLPQRLRLRAGQRVRIQIEREGRQLDVRLRAAERPTDLFTGRMFGLSLQTDSMVETMFRAMDSLRVHLLEANPRGARVVSPSGPTGGRIAAVTQGRQEMVGAPFEFFVFRGEQHDSLRREMENLNGEIEELRRREGDRLTQLGGAISRVGARSQAPDEELSELGRAIEDVMQRSASLRTAMAAAARATAGLDYTLTRSPDAAPRAGSGPDHDAYRPLTPYLLGSNRVAGAEVIDLRPGLAEYFEVEGGVLVVDVSPGTPAAIAGIRPGDVVTRLDQVSIRAVEDLRFGVSRAEGPLPLTLIRQGATLQVLLPRR